MKCPQCDHSIQQVGRFSICPEHGIVPAGAAAGGDQVAPAPAGGSADGLRARVLTRYPFAIAYGYKHTVDPENNATGLKNFFFTYQATVQYATLVLLSEFLTSARQQPRLANAIVKLRAPCLSHWITALLSLAKYSGEADFAPELVRAVARFKNLRYGDERLHDVIRKWRNEHDGHSATWSEHGCGERLTTWLPYLDEVLETFGCLAELHPVRSSPLGRIRLIGSEQPSEEHLVSDAELMHLFDESELVVVDAAGAVASLYPLFVGPEIGPHGDIEPLLAFFGHTRREVVYQGVTGQAPRRDELARYHDLLQRKHIDPRFRFAELEPWAVSDWARESTRISLENLRGTKYFPDRYQPRRAAKPCQANDADTVDASLGVDDIVEHWLERGRESALILAAEAGAGKTSLLCNIAERLIEDAAAADCVLLLLGGSVRVGGTNALFARIRDGLGFSDDHSAGGLTQFRQLLDCWRRVGEQAGTAPGLRRLVVLVDAVNEAAEPKALLEEIGTLAEVAAAANRRAGQTFARLLVSVRVDRIDTLAERWAERSDAPFLLSPHNFAHFEDQRGRDVPYLTMRRFTAHEARAAYERAQQVLESPCRAGWAELGQATQDLVAQPLLLALFHDVFAGQERPPGVVAGDALWSAWLSQSFDARDGSPVLKARALDLTDACIDAGSVCIPEHVADDWRSRWRADQGNDPVRIAAALDWLERLTEAGLLREREDGGLDWVSDSVAEQLMFRALSRRDRSFSQDSVRGWLELPATPHLDEALVRVGLALWSHGRSKELAAWATTSAQRPSCMLGRVLMLSAPLGSSEQVREEQQFFVEQLHSLQQAASSTGMNALGILGDALAGEVAPYLEAQLGGTATLRPVLECARHIAEQRVVRDSRHHESQRSLRVAYTSLGILASVHEPDQALVWFDQALTVAKQLQRAYPASPICLRDLRVAYTDLGTLHAETDPAQAGARFEQARVIAEQLVALRPDDRQYLRDLRVLCTSLGTLAERSDPGRARAWFETALAIATDLVASEPDNRMYLRDLRVAHRSLGALDTSGSPIRARARLERAVHIAERLVALEPDNPVYLRDLRVSCTGLGTLDEWTDPKRARTSFDKAVQLAVQLAAVEPENRMYQRDLRVSYRSLGALLHASDPDAARGWFGKSLEIAERLVELEPNSRRFQRDLRVTYTGLGSLAILRDQVEAATWLRKALEIAERLALLEPNNASYRRDLSLSYRKLGELSQQRDPARARSWYRRAIPLVEEQAGDTNAGSLCDLASCLIGLAFTQRFLGEDTAAQTSELRAHELALRAASLTPKHNHVQLTLARASARLGHEEQALNALAAAVEIGNVSADEMANDPHLSTLDEVPRFRDLLSQVRRR